VPRHEDQSSNLRRPNCFGDPREHDPRDRTCERCRWEQTCAVIVKNKRRDDREDRGDRREDRDTRRDGRRGPGPSIAVNPDPESYLEREEASLGFFEALMFNGVLSGARAGLVESVFALDQIPRAPYEDPFREIMKKRTAAKRPTEQRPADRRPRDEEDEDE
jgi:hypothetical protein